MFVKCPHAYNDTYTIPRIYFLKKIMGQPGLFFIYFRLFKHTPQFFTTNKCENCPSSIWCWDSNSRSLEHESPPITTRPGLPPLFPTFTTLKCIWSTYRYYSILICMFSLLRSINVLLFATIPASFLFIFVFSIQMIAYGKIAVGWIWTVDLWRRKRPLIHNKYTIFEMKNKVLLHDSSKTLVSHCFFGLLNQLPEHYWMFYLQIAGFKPRTSIWWQTLCPWLWLSW